MSDIVIKAENISKQYRLGQVGTGTLSHDINRLWHKVRGKEDPYLKIGETNDRSQKGNSDYVWALRDINFDVKRGEVLGIIGKNGAGKSTLLKILSRTTTPTKGNIKIKGRIASLLEVGTGFHPELSGKENIYLNGAILGMTKHEIKRKFDEIVSFAGVERYIETPVKRYSSGMYVRLAFAVAAHLESEILIVDEVLAVGDAEFQKKCLGKMKSVSEKGGRTVLFVSHNMTAVKTLCNTGIFLQNGTISSMGLCDEVVDDYLRNYSELNLKREWSLEAAPGNDEAKLTSAEVKIGENRNAIYAGEPVELEFTYFNSGNTKEEEYAVTFHLFDEMSNLVLVASNALTYPQKQMSGWFTAKAKIPENLLQEGTYTIGRLLFIRNSGQVVLEQNDILTFEVVNNQQAFGWMGRKEGIVKPRIEWDITISNQQ